MKNVNFLRAARKTEGQAGGLHKKAVKRAAEKGGEAAENGGPEGCSAYWAARLNVQPTGPSCSAACRPALLCSSPPGGKFISLFSFGNTALQPPALRLVLSGRPIATANKIQQTKMIHTCQ